MEANGEPARLCVPLISRGQSVDVLTVSWRTAPPPLGEDVLDFAQALGEQLATALQSERFAVAAGESSEETAE